MKLQKKTFFISILITLLLSACGDKASESRVLAPAEQIDYALTEGDSSVIQDEAVPLLEQQILDKIASIKALQTDTISAIYQGQSINYQVGTETAVFTYADSYYALESVFPLVNGNGGNHLALAGEKSGTRYAMFGTGLIDQYFRLGSNLAFEPHFLRTISWLLKQQPVSNTSLNVKTRVAISHFSATAETNTINWLTGKFDQWEFTSCNDGATLASCYQNKDLILLASEGALSEEAEQTKAAIAGAVAAGVPVLYQHSGSKLSNTVSTELLTNWNAFLSATNYTNDAAVWAATVEMLNSDPIANRLNDLQTMFEHLKNADFSFDFSGCFDIACQQGSDYQVNFHRGAYYLRTVLRYLENQKLQLFSLGGHELVKLAVLLADKYRQNAVFPMFVTDPDLNPFMRSQYADYAVYNLRKFNPAQRDMGNFSRSDFSHITPLTRTLDLTSHIPLRAAGVYALPGETVRITRLDNSATSVKVYINATLSGAVHAYGVPSEINPTWGYVRPQYVQSEKYALLSGESIEITSPYGGPIQVDYTANDLAVQLRFENVGEHPVWRSPADDASFIAQLNANQYDWAEMITNHMEIHSTREKMMESISNPLWPTPSALANIADTYLFGYTHSIGGFKGEGIPVEAEVQTIANSHGWTIPTFDKIIHVVADMAVCGAACAGNPYTSSRMFSGLGVSDEHEVGHSLEAYGVFDNFGIHGATNLYGAYAKAKYMEDGGTANLCRMPPHQDRFNILQASVGQPDPAAYIRTQFWDIGWDSGGYVFLLQIMMAAENQGALSSGWNLRALYHVLENEWELASQSDVDWLAKRASLGFSTYARSEVGFFTIPKNDRMLIMYSYAMQRDIRPYMDMWGMSYSTKASDQVASFGFTPLTKTFYASPDNGACTGLNHPAVPIDGTSPWPL